MMLIAVNAFCGELIADAPKQINEYENFKIKISTNENFKIIISNKCLTVSSFEGFDEKDGVYSSEDGGKISFDNFCFEGDEVDIEIKTDKDSEKLHFKIQPRIEEERSYGC